jgi:hypothetical protein
MSSDAVVVLDDEALLASGLLLVNVHPVQRCAGQRCVLHNPSAHHMRGWHLHWRGDRGIFERLCPHGIGHPDPDQADHWRETGRTAEGVHGCDGCCVP